MYNSVIVTSLKINDIPQNNPIKNLKRSIDFSILFFAYFSPAIPPKKEKIIFGNILTSKMVPIANVDPVILITSHDKAIVYIPEPTVDKPCPTQILIKG